LNKKYQRFFLSLCHLYYKTSSYKNIEKIYDAFDGFVTIDFDTIENLDDYSIYIIELEYVDQELSKRLVGLFKHKAQALIYFIIPKKHTLMLFQLTYLLGTKSIITQNQNVTKLIEKIKIERELFLKNSFVNWLGHVSIKTQNFVVYRNRKLNFVNKMLLDSFRCDTDELFEMNVLVNVDIEKLLDQNTTYKANLNDHLNIKKMYIFRSESVENGEKIIYIDSDPSSDEELGFISSRVSFVELLKEKLLQRTISEQKLSLFSVKITNMKMILELKGLAELERILFETLSFMDSILEKKLVFSQLEQNFYVVFFEDVDFEQINIIAEHFNTKVINYISKKKNKITLEIMTFSLENLEFSDILLELHKIETDKFKVTQKNSHYIKEINKAKKVVNEKNLLDTAYEDKLTFKLLNIYNGLIINTKSNILKVTDEHVYVSFTQLQGVVLNIDKQTILQSSSFSQDIEANVKKINFKKQIAVLENFKFLNTNANSRRYARVTPLTKMPIAIHVNSKIINGVILDLSIKSIAIKVKYIETIGLPDLQKSSLLFNIVNKRSELGYVQLTLKAKVIVVTPQDTDGYYKVVCDLEEGSHDLDILLQYVYERQKELIIELKKMTKLT
jgi:GGDEF domain-containing protein